MIYVDTSVLVALHINEQASPEVAKWYQSCRSELVSSVWCVTEFASALSIKQRTGSLTSTAANQAWLNFERLCNNDLQLLQLDSLSFHKAAVLALDHSSSLRSGDALHLAAAIDAKALSMATLDAALATNSKRQKLKLVFDLKKKS